MPLSWDSPCSRTISRTPWKKPRYLGLGEVWSWINFTYEEMMHLSWLRYCNGPKGLPATSCLAPGMVPRPELTHAARQLWERSWGKAVPMASSAFCRGKPGKLPLQAAMWGLHS